MINLTEFISKKLGKDKNQYLKPQEQFHEVYNAKKSNIMSNYNSSQRSLGLSTLLDIQYQEQSLENLGISHIHSYKKTLGMKQTLGTRTRVHLFQKERTNIKSEVEQMRQKRMKVQKKLGLKLTKSQFYKKFGKIQNDQSKYSDENDVKRSDIDEYQKQQRSKQSSQEKELSLKSGILNQSMLKSSERSNFQSQQSLSNKSSFNSSIQHNFYKKQDPFLNYLMKQAFCLKCQKFICKVKVFANKWLMRQLQVSIKFRKIIRRENKKLSRYVFIEWKRAMKQEENRDKMIEMIRNRIKQKRSIKHEQQLIGINEARKDRQEVEIEKKQYQERQIDQFQSQRALQAQPINDFQRIQMQNCLQKSQLQINYQSLNNNLSQNIQHAYNSIKCSQLVNYYSNQMPDSQISRINLQQISPIKHNGDNFDLSQINHFRAQSQPDYEEYRCYTQRNQELNQDEQEEWVK